MRCGIVTQVMDSTGGLVVPVNGGVGDLLAVAPMGDPTCASYEVLVLTPAEYAALGSPFNITADEGGSIAAAVMLVWATGWAARMVIRALQETDSDSYIGHQD